MIIPVFNHASTLLHVARGALRHAPVIVVDDGSTDGARALLEGERAIESIFEPVNRGKGRALNQGFRRARERGFTHAITLDADGQHDPDQIPDFVSEIERHSASIILGCRDFRQAGVPAGRRRANAFSSFWHRVQTGRALSDTQCGFRAYPLGPVNVLSPSAERYGFEFEMIVHAAWAGIEIHPIPIRADYAAPTSRRSHFRPVLDFARMSLLNAKLTFQALALPPPLRRIMVERSEPKLSLAEKIARALREFAQETDRHPLNIGVSVALGVALGVAIGLLPLWGFRSRLITAIARSKTINDAAIRAGFQLTEPLAALLPLALAFWLGWADALEFVLPNASGLEQGLIAWFALCSSLALFAGALAFNLVRITGRTKARS